MNRETKKKIKILLIDKDSSYAERVEAFLTKDGFRVKVVSSLLEAIEELKSSRYQIVLLDFDSSELGAVALEDLTRVDSDAAYIAMTSNRSVEQSVQAMRAGVFDYQPKSLGEEELIELLLLTIKRKGLVIDFEKKINLEIGKKVRQLRKERALTLKQLATRTGLSISLISQIERAKSSSSVSTLYKLATALNVKLEHFFAGL